MKWTEEQQDAIYKKGSNILVAAAAGSGKTAVLVERIINKILNENVDIDKLLVVTFTNAAASEMRERVLEAIYKKLDEDPSNENLQKQIILLGKSNICTIHSFCLEVIKNNFFELDLSANFRIASEEEIEIIKQETLEEVFEKLYESEDENFAKLVETYTGYHGDEPLKEMVLSIYRFMQASPFPLKWLDEKVELFNNDIDSKDFSESIWGKILLESLREEILDAINGFRILREKLATNYDLEKYLLVIEEDISVLKKFYEMSNVSWDDAFEYLELIQSESKFKRWPTDKKIISNLKDEVKASRDTLKKKILKEAKTILSYNSKAAYLDLYEMYDILKILENVIIAFDEEFKKKKKEKNLIDFNDIEHFALQILVKEENGIVIPSEVAKKYQEKFVEIAIDEYQDSNQVQEMILSSVSRNNNLFMVGDIKQSIYKFRQACPDIFSSKYESYSLKESNENGLKIQLFKNFRSRESVLDITNTIFETIMSRKLGDIDYNQTEFLNYGADFENTNNEENLIVNTPEIDIIDFKDEVDQDIWKDEDSSQTESSEDDEDLNKESAQEIKQEIEKEELEAKLICKKIKELINSKVKIKDKKEGFREIKYKDIVILLRSTARMAPIYEQELLKENIPVFSDSSNEYLDTIEIQTIINLLKVLDNPIDDIALVSTLRSKIGKFTDNEIVEIRYSNNAQGKFYFSLIDAKDNLKNEILKNKVNAFLELINNWKEESNYISLAQLIWKIYSDTGFLNYVGLMPNGSLRQANLRMLFERAKEYEKTSFKGLYSFISYIEKLKNSNSDMSSAKIIGENEDVVRIMSIHKSKGLEFPVVILSNTAKKINMQDTSSKLLLHKDYGIGPEYINYNRMVQYSTAAKDAIKIKIKEETISEEMRILYVALTRAKEKLIIIGTQKDYKKEIESKKEFLKVYGNTDKLNPILLKKYISYLDWIELIILKNKEFEESLDINIIKKDDVDTEEIEEVTYRKFNFEKEIDSKKIEDLLSLNYKYSKSIELPIKSTVSKIKEMKQEELLEFSSLNKNEIGLGEYIPKFMEEDKITSARKGTLMHLFMQKLDLKHDYTMEELLKLRDNLVLKNIITEEESKTLNIGKVEKFLESNLRQKIKECKMIEKEKAFCIKINANEVYTDAINNEKILVQGIIDLYGVDNNDNIILVDYKTDFVENDEKKLVEKYREQLRIYKEALEKSTYKNVSEIYIYSLYLNKEIKVLF